MNTIKTLKKILYALFILASIILMLSGISGFIYYLTNFDGRVLGFSILCGVFSILMNAMSFLSKDGD